MPRSREEEAGYKVGTEPACALAEMALSDISVEDYGPTRGGGCHAKKLLLQRNVSKSSSRREQLESL